MQDPSISASERMSNPNRTVFIGIAAIVAILLIAAVVLFFTLPDAGAFNARV